MGHTHKKNPDAKLASKLAKSILTQTSKVLYYTGKPFYRLFSLIILILISTTYITGYATRKLVENTTKAFPIYIVNFKYELAKAIENLRSYADTFSLNLSKKKKHKIIWSSQKEAYLSFFKKVKGLKSKTSDYFRKFFKTLFSLLSKKLASVKISISLLYLKAKLRLINFKVLFKKPKFRKKSPFRIKLPSGKKIRIRYFLLVFLLTLFIGVPISAFIYIKKDLPSPRKLLDREVEVSSKIYDRNGILLYKIYKNKNRTVVPLSQIPLEVKLATLAAEDSEFYSHPGFSLKGIIRALIKNIDRNELTGGSTITQQLVKNTLLSSEKTLVRKVKEIVLAISVERTFSKDEILEMYLNEVAYGGTAYGIQEAARLYFDKDVENLSLAEAALVAGLPKSPTKYSPFGPNPELAHSRQKDVLNLMKINGYITKDQYEAAEKENLKFAENKTEIKAPHFVMYVREILEQEFGKEMVEKGGLEVITTLDYQIQRLAEKVIKEEVERLEKLNVGNGAALIINPTTGEILAMVGSYDYFDFEKDGNVNLTIRPRQPGSAIKIVNYAYALSNGLTAATILSDSPITFLIPEQPPYSPKNYDNTFRGNLTLRSAFAESRNVPAVKVLAGYGVDKMIEMGRNMGITTWSDPNQYGLSLTLGGGEVKLIDLANAYATIANYGKKPELFAIKKVTDQKGKILDTGCKQNEKTKIAKVIGQVLASEIAPITNSSKSLLNEDGCVKEQVIDPRVAYLLVDILRDNEARTPSFGSNSQLVIPKHKEVAVKTGTSNDLRDNLTIGFNQNYLVATWVGNNDNSPMSRIASGLTGASSIWNKIMSALLIEKENHPWDAPPGLIQLPICTLTGTLSCQGCPTKMEWFLEENRPQIACSPELPNSQEDKEKKEKESRKTLPGNKFIYPTLKPSSRD